MRAEHERHVIDEIERLCLRIGATPLTSGMRPRNDDGWASEVEAPGRFDGDPKRRYTV